MCWIVFATPADFRSTHWLAMQNRFYQSMHHPKLNYPRQNIELNKLPLKKTQFIEGDVFQVLRKFRDEARTFDMIILDPPKFTPTATQVERARAAIKISICWHSSCFGPMGFYLHSHVLAELTRRSSQKIISATALDAGVDSQISEHRSQTGIINISFRFPEGTYRKGLVCIKN